MQLGSLFASTYEDIVKDANTTKQSRSDRDSTSLTQLRCNASHNAIGYSVEYDSR